MIPAPRQAAGVTLAPAREPTGIQPAPGLAALTGPGAPW
jgi:hypothetical protein